MNEITDVNVHLSRWPFRRLPEDETSALVKKLRHHHVAQAWAGTFDGLLHKDISSANERLAEECREHGRGILVPFGSINPMLPDWPEDLRRCHEIHRMRGIRLHPNYHGYKLSEAIFAAVLEAATRRGLIVQLAVSMEDRRSQHPLVQVPTVDLGPLPDLMRQFPNAKIVLLNSLQFVNGQLLLRLAATGRIWFDLATLEGVGGVGRLIQQVSATKILFGTNAPFFYPEAAFLKMTESDLEGAAAERIWRDNAKSLLKSA